MNYLPAGRLATYFIVEFRAGKRNAYFSLSLCFCRNYTGFLFDDFVDEAVGFGFVGGHVVVSVGVLFDLGEWFAGFF